MSTPPTVSTMLFCDNAIIEAGSRKSSVIGIFERIRASKFPWIQNCFLFLQITGGRGESQCFIRVTEIRTGEIRFNLPVRVDFKNPEGILAWCLGVTLGISGPGTVQADFVCGGDVIRSVRLQVEDVSGSLDLGVSGGTSAGIPDGLPPEASNDPDWWKKPKQGG